MDKVGRFRILEELGGGGFARVYRAWDPAHHRPAALKIPHLRHAADWKARERFCREVWALQQLRHPNIVQLFDAGEADGRPYLAMELLAGPSLADLNRGRPYPLAEVARWAMEMAAAIDASHAAGIVNGDIKPGNFLFADDGRLVLTDFGIGGPFAVADANATETVVGTLRYLAPECWAGLAPGAKSDIYAFGVLLYELLAGHPPFQGDIFALAAAHHHTPPRPLTELRAGFPSAAWAALAPALAKDPADRPGRATPIAQSLAAAAGWAVAPAPDADRTERIPLARLRPALAAPFGGPASAPPVMERAERHGRIRLLLAQALAVPLIAGFGAATMALYLAQGGNPAGGDRPGASPGPAVAAQQAPPTPTPSPIARPTPTPSPSARPTPTPFPTRAGPRAAQRTPRPTATPTPFRPPVPTIPPWWVRR
jgi:serine/threonine-protein kinase